MPSADGGWIWVPGKYQLPEVLPYREGQFVPHGYHLEERPIRAAIITGYVLTAVPYVIGALVASTSGFPNQSGFLLVPWAGPWITLGLRKNRCETSYDESYEETTDHCVEDTAAGVALAFDGIIQAAGGTLLVVGYLVTKTKMVRDAPAVSFTLRPMGAGYGLSAFGSF